MMKNRSYFLPLLFTIFYSGCNIPNDGTTSSDLIPPFIYDAATSLNVINFGVITIPAGKTTVDTTITVYVSIADDNGLSDISAVSYVVIKPDGNLLTQGTLSDNGISPDGTANDGNYNATLSIKFPKDILGIYQIQFQTVDNSGLASIVRSFPIKIFNSANVAPVISNLSAPDTVLIPSGNLVNYIRISITVADEDGLTDIVSVSLTSFRPNLSNAGTYFLYDDGGTVKRQDFKPFELTSGDSTANDGRYTIEIPITSSSEKNTYRDFQFVAKDQSGAFSNTITKRVHIQ